MIRVLDDKVAVRVLEATSERTASGLYIAPSADNAQIVSGEVVAVGTEMDDWNGPDEAPTPVVKLGDIVHINKFTSSLITSKKDGKLFIVKRADILAVETE